MKKKKGKTSTKIHLRSFIDITPPRLLGKKNEFWSYWGSQERKAIKI